MGGGAAGAAGAAPWTRVEPHGSSIECSHTYWYSMPRTPLHLSLSLVVQLSSQSQPAGDTEHAFQLTHWQIGCQWNLDHALAPPNVSKTHVRQTSELQAAA